MVPLSPGRGEYFRGTPLHEIGKPRNTGRQGQRSGLAAAGCLCAGGHHGYRPDQRSPRRGFRRPSASFCAISGPARKRSSRSLVASRTWDRRVSGRRSDVILVLFPDRLQWLTNLTTREPSASASDSNSSTFPLRQIPSTDFSPGVDRAMRLRLPKFNEGGRPLGRIAGISELCRSMGAAAPQWKELRLLGPSAGHQAGTG